MSKNLGTIVGLRPTNGMVIDMPSDFNYECPICKDGYLHWSEYNGFIRCENCKKDIPSCLCATDIQSQIEIFLYTIQEIKGKKTGNHNKNSYNDDIR